MSQEIRELEKRIKELRAGLNMVVNTQTMEIINELIDAEIELESYCNQ